MKPENKNQNSIFCKKLRYGNQQSPTILLGVIINDSKGFLEFKTAHKNIIISKNSIISIEDTREIFQGVVEDD